MWAWLRRLFCGEETRAPAPPAPEPVEPTVPEELTEALDVVRKMARAQSKLALKVDELDATLSRRFDELQKSAPPPQPPLAWGDLLDSMDLLQHAIDGLDPARDDVSEGLRRVLGRLDRFLAQGGISRVGARGDAVDGRLFRVVGTEARADLAPGTIARVVRSAAVREGQVVREGEVLTVRRES